MPAAVFTRRSMSSRGVPRMRSPNARLSNTVMCGYRAYDWNTIAMSRSRGGTSLTTRSPMRISPSEISSRPASMRRQVDLPQPEGPTSTMNSVSLTSSEKSLTASVPPENRLDT